ncbi:MAG: XTP/dITP diphosphatase [Desulfomonile tiedjei]|nr:XTP/dITP diphosphatase [Desulfomonile tiedjei]
MHEIPPTILIATKNRGKVAEISDLVKDLSVTFLSLADVANAPDVIEDGATFEENALKKARVIAKATGVATIADDSGLCVDALDGRPGVFSARYAGEHATDAQKCAGLLEEMRDVPNELRTARFICVIALVTPDGEERLFHGVCEGRITFEPRGDGGFGYDPIFYNEQAGRTFAEMERDEKNLISHRGRALRQFSAYLRGFCSPASLP